MAEIGAVIFRFTCRGKGVVGLAQGLVLGLDLSLGFVLGLGLDLIGTFLGTRGDGEGEVALEKKEVIWLC